MDDILHFRCRFSPFFLFPFLSYMPLHLFLTSMTQHTNKTHSFVIIIVCEERCMFVPFVSGNLMCSDVANTKGFVFHRVKRVIFSFTEREWSVSDVHFQRCPQCIASIALISRERMGDEPLILHLPRTTKGDTERKEEEAIFPQSETAIILNFRKET